VSVIILTGSETHNISECIQSIDNLDCPLEIIVVGDGYMGGDAAIFRTFSDIKLSRHKSVSSTPERGTQISSGINAAQNDVIVLLHADSRLLPGAITRMLRAFRENDSAIGGCFGAIHDDSRPSIGLNRLAPVWNRIWTIASGISLVDQVKFFRREALPDRFPAIKLMADIELSLRMKENGALIFIPCGVKSSAKRRKQARNWSDFMKTIYETTRYLMLRRLGLVK
jgi:cellulose synthase/poly-beta-1,6-N-acetylglucosamine synthase-like glycosyltransferase